DLLNPGAQDVQSIAGVSRVPAPDLSARVIPAGIAGALVAAVTFALLYTGSRVTPPPAESTSDQETYRVNPFRAIVPLVPIVLLLAAYAGVPWMHWLIATPPGADWAPFAGALPIVRAMLIGSVLAGLAALPETPRLISTLFDGMGRAY